MSPGRQSAPGYGLIETDSGHPLDQRTTSRHELQGCQKKKVRCHEMVGHDVETTSHRRNRNGYLVKVPTELAFEPISTGKYSGHLILTPQAGSIY